MAIDQLNAKLKMLLGLPCAADDYKLWPTTELRVEEENIDADQCVAYGLEKRPDLNLLRSVLHNLNRHTVPVVGQLLGGVNVLLSGPPQSQGGFAGVRSLCNGSLQDFRHKVETLLEKREEQAAAEIRERAREVVGHFQLAVLARQRADIAQKKVAELEEKKNKGIAVEADLSRAKLDRAKARGDLLHEVVAWEIARFRLKEAQGLLVRECSEHPSCP
jgi:hypothetical protein